MTDSVKEILNKTRVNKIVRQIRVVMKYIKNEAHINPTSNFEPIECSISHKKMVYIDKAAENLLAKKLKEIFNADYDVEIYGEESLGLKQAAHSESVGRFSSTKSRKKGKIIFLLDAIDGTDLYLKNLGNWCTAVLIMNENRQVLGSFVGLPNGAIYFSTTDIHFVVKVNSKGKPTKVTINTDKSDLKNVTLAWYGQKAKNFLPIARNKKFIEFLQNQPRTSNFRILNIGGIPLMMKLIDNIVPVDVIIELYGQQPHDMIAGGFLAQKANAILTDLNGKSINFSNYLHDFKGEKIKYILATSKKCHTNALKIFGRQKK